MHVTPTNARLLTVAAVTLLCSSVGFSQALPTVTSASFGKTANGTPVTAYTLTNSKGFRAKVITYGGVLASLEVPDRDGKLANIVRSYDTVASYESNQWTGAIIGRFANRIGNAKFSIDGIQYNLTVNSSPHQLHGGGSKAFSQVVWNADPCATDTEARVVLTHLSLDGEEGYPGNVFCTVTYALTDANELRINYLATTDKPTVINMTNHSYFNLAGYGNGNILSHEVTINGSWYTDAGSDKVPTGEIRTVTGTALEYRTPRPISQQIASVSRDSTYDHNYVLNRTYGMILMAAKAYDPKTGRVMECYTDQPGMQFYTGDQSAFCFETQHFPDSPNKGHFPTTELRPGTPFSSVTVYKFSTK
jgi:aldose 1-epimerase